MKAISVTLASTLIFSLVSCTGTKSTQVPDMPYRPAAKQPPTPATAPSQGEPTTISDDQLLPPINSITPTTPAASAPIPAPAPAPVSTPSYGSALIPTTPPAVSAPKGPVVSSTGYAPTPQVPSIPTAAPTPPPTSSTPVATRVAGDPHRVYNPWNPNQRIRITDPKTGLPFPSGKVLGIPGSTNKFIVP
ncbi:MAG: hypothetical protein R3Y56_06490 [Akkermansia sp.]